MFNLSKKPKPYNRMMYRHGDLLITKINAIPEDTVQINDKIIAEGEISGHKHKIFGSAQVHIRPSFIDRPINENSEVWFNAFDEIKLGHEEHKTLEIPKGVYKVTKEQQFDPFQGITHQVID